MPDVTTIEPPFAELPGEMARLIGAKDWAGTRLGPITGWPVPLRTAVAMILGARLPMALCWGETRALIYNDAWAPMLGEGHPVALGRPGGAGDGVIGESVGRVFADGVPVSARMPPDRSGRGYDIGFGPIPGDGGRVAGVFLSAAERPRDAAGVASDDLREANRRLAEREAFLTSVLASSTDCIKVLDLDGRLNFMSEGGKKIMEVSDFNAIAGCPWPDFWEGSGNVEAKAAVAAARAGQPRSFIGFARTMAGSPRWWDVAVSPILGPDGRPERILSVSRDITATRANEEQRRQLVRIIENSADFIGMARMDGSVFFLNDAALALVGLDRDAIDDVDIADFFPPDEAGIVLGEVLPAVQRDGSWSGERSFRHFRTGELIPILYTVFRVLDSDGQQVGYGTVTRDFRERKRAEERLKLLNNELGHRLKNLLTVVQSVASQTLRQAEDMPSAARALAARLSALGEATNVLTASSWESADLARLAAQALAPHGELGDRIRVSGPEITLQPQVTLALALALHELATNAAKYGALSVPGGHVDLSWAVTDGPADDQRRFALRWKESGGPRVQAPSRRGFGSIMIERSLRAYFHGEAQIAYPADGVEFTLECPLGDAGRLNG